MPVNCRAPASCGGELRGDPPPLWLRSGSGALRVEDAARYSGGACRPASCSEAKLGPGRAAPTVAWMLEHDSSRVGSPPACLDLAQSAEGQRRARRSCGVAHAVVLVAARVGQRPARRSPGGPSARRSPGATPLDGAADSGQVQGQRRASPKLARTLQAITSARRAARRTNAELGDAQTSAAGRRRRAGRAAGARAGDRIEHSASTRHPRRPATAVRSGSGGGACAAAAIARPRQGRPPARRIAHRPAAMIDRLAMECLALHGVCRAAAGRAARPWRARRSWPRPWRGVGALRASTRAAARGGETGWSHGGGAPRRWDSCLSSGLKEAPSPCSAASRARVVALPPAGRLEGDEQARSRTSSTGGRALVVERGARIATPRAALTDGLGCSTSAGCRRPRSRA